MAFSTEQKALIKKRAEELITSGIGQGQAAQQAVNELFTAEELQSIYAPVPAPEPIEPIVETRTPEIQEVDVKLEEAQADYVRERSRQLRETQQMEEEEARKTALAEVEQNIKEPVPLGFGGVDERKESPLFGAPDLLPEPLAPRETPIAAQQGARGVDFVEIGKVFQKTFKESPEDAQADVEAFKTFFFEPALARLKGSGVVGQEAERQALEEAFEGLSDIAVKIGDKDTYLKAPEQVGSGDPWIRAFSKQVDVGEGVPDLSEAQRQFLNSRTERAKQKQVASRSEETTEVVVLADGTEMPREIYDIQIRQQPELGEPVSTKQVLKTEGQLRREVDEADPTPWWLTDKASEIKADPEKFETFGFFTTETPFGTKKETTGSWILRSAMSPMNVAAGAVAEAAYGFGPLEEAREEARPEGYKDNPILLNVAEGRGMFGEAKEAAELAGLSSENLPVLYYTTLAGGFAADILDPSLDVAKAAGVAGRAGVQNLRGAKAVYGTLDSARTGEALGGALKLGVNDFLDSSLIGAPYKERFEAGDVRGLISRNVTEEMNIATLADELAFEGKTADELIEALTPAQRKTPFGKKLIEEIDKAPESALDEVLEAAIREDDLLNEAVDVSRSLDDYVEVGGAGAVGRIRRKDLQRALGSLAKVDPAVASVFKGGRSLGLGKIVTTLAEQSPESFRRLKTLLNYDLASKRVAKATKDISGLGDQNVVAVTHNTWASKTDAKKILQTVKESDLGKLTESFDEVELIVTNRGAISNPASRLPRGVDQPTKTAPRVLPAYKLDDKSVDTIVQTASDLQKQGKMDGITYNQIITDIRNSKGITIENFRKLLDAEIDLVAEGLAATAGAQVTRARDLARLSIGEQLDFLQPLESRSFSRTAWRKITEKLTGRTPKASTLSLGQRQLLDKARTRISSLDVTLRKDIQRLVEDAEMQRAYGIIKEGEDAIPLTRQEALGHLIVGPERSLTEGSESIRAILDDILADMFYTKTTKENIFDLFTGTKVQQNTKVFSSAGMDRIGAQLNDLADEINLNPSKFWENVNEAVRLAKTEIIDAGDPDLLRYAKDEITSVIDNSKGVIPAEVQLAAYYRTEAQKVADEVISDLINTEIGKGRLAVQDAFSAPFRKEMLEVIDEQFGAGRLRPFTTNATAGVAPTLQVLGQDFSSRVIKNRLVGRLSDGRGGVSVDDIQEVLGDKFPPSLTKQAMDNPRFVSVMETYFDVADDIADGIIRRNNIENTEIGMDQAERLIDDLTDADGEAGAQLRVLFGDDVASQLQDDLRKGFEGTREQLLLALERKYSGKATDQVLNVLDKTKTGIENLRYSLILNARPRFHGANLLTGADIYYGTTGRLPDPRDIFEGAKVLRNKNPNAVIFTDPSGRAYTSGELNEILETATGRSVYQTAAPSANVDRMLDFLDERGIGAKLKGGDKLSANLLPTRAKDLAEAFKDLPQSEDLLYRYAALKSALREGRSIEDATALARKSMFDIGDIETSALPDAVKKAEANFRRLALFYGFQRNSLMNAIKNLSSAGGLKRIVKAKRFKDNTEALLVDDETSEYSPSYAQTRIILKKLDWKPEEDKSLILTSPPLQSLDAIYTLAELLKGEPQGIIGGFIRPEYKAALGIEDKFSRELDEVPPEHINILKSVMDRPEDAVNLLLSGFGAEPVGGFENKDGRLAIPLNTPKQKKAYRLFMDSMSMAGLSAPVTDFSRTFLPEDTKVGAMGGGALGQAAFATAAVTPMTYLSPEKQAYYDRLSRLRSLQQMVTSVKATEAERDAVGVTPEEKEKMDKIVDKKKQIRIKKKTAPTKVQRTRKEIINERKRAVSRRRRGEISAQQLKKIMAESKKELDALKE